MVVLFTTMKGAGGGLKSFSCRGGLENASIAVQAASVPGVRTSNAYHIADISRVRGFVFVMNGSCTVASLVRGGGVHRAIIVYSASAPI